MSHHARPLKIAQAFRQSCCEERYSKKRFFKDLLAGLTVGVIAIPLAMALAIASGVAPEYGLYSTIVAGFLIPLLGGSRYSISGPTAAFVVILYPIAQQFGLAGLLISTLFSSLILLLLAFFRLGRLIEHIPDSVILGFTAGIAAVIALLQVKDFLGLSIVLPDHNLSKFWLLIHSLNLTHEPSLWVAIATFGSLLIWPKLKTPVPPHLPALFVGTLLAYILAKQGMTVETIGSRFHFTLPDGSLGQGVPPFFPHFEWPWLQPGPKGGVLVLSLSTLSALLWAAVGMALLGAIESLLCAVILDGLTGRRHSANSELFGQGIGNLIAPFFGGITATAAIARSAVNVRSGAESPVAGMIHALVVLLGLVGLAPLLAYLPMPALAALLIMVAWGMSEAHKAIQLLKTAAISDKLVFLTCFILTIVFDMVIGVSVGLILAFILWRLKLKMENK